MTTWQEQLDAQYPYGASITQIEDVPEGVGHDDSTQFLTPRLIVAEEGEQPTITMQIVEMDKDITLKLVKAEEFSPGVTLFHTPDDEPDFLVSTNLSDEIKNTLRRIRREWYEELS